MRRMVATACCLLWLCYGSLSGLAHIHADHAPDQMHGLGLDHAHDSHEQATGHDHPGQSHTGRFASDAHHDSPLYWTSSAVKPDARSALASIDLAGEVLAPPPAS